MSIMTPDVLMVPCNGSICLLRWPHWISWASASSACCHNMQRVLVSVDMTWVSARFDEPIKDGLSSQCHTDGETRPGQPEPREGVGPVEPEEPEEPEETTHRGVRYLNSDLISAGLPQWSGGWSWRAASGVRGSGATQGTHTNERRARTRLRCRESKLAAHLGCRSHLWKMQTSSPSFSSGKTRLLFIHDARGCGRPSTVQGADAARSITLTTHQDEKAEIGPKSLWEHLIGHGDYFKLIWCARKISHNQKLRLFYTWYLYEILITL